MQQFCYRFLLFSLCLSQTFAESYIYDGKASMVGKNSYVIADHGLNQSRKLPEIYKVGFDHFFNANPQLSPDSPIEKGDVFIIPNHVILAKPIAPNHILVNIAEKRLFFYHKKTNKLYVFPIGIGRSHTPTPLGKTHIIHKRYKPTWHVTKEGLQEAYDNGYLDHPKTIPPGPDNPLGDYALHLSKGSYLIHSTNDPEKIGTQNTAGCINLYREHIQVLHELTIVKKTPVEIINQPIKSTLINQMHWTESHTPPLISSTLPEKLSSEALITDTQTQEPQELRHGIPIMASNTIIAENLKA